MSDLEGAADSSPAPLAVSSSWWDYVNYAAHEAYLYSLAHSGTDPRGPPGTIHYDASVHGVNAPIM